MDPFGDKQFQVMESYHYQPSDPCPPLPTSHWVVEGEPTTSSLGFMAKERRRGGKRGGGVKLSTDPQSVAARQRRHRISDRFKILKSLVPGGSKMDTVSMLEEAINYVKFLKAQIRLHQTALMFHPDDYSSLISFPTSAISASAAASAGGTAADSINTSCMLLPNEQVLLPSEQISSFTMEPWQQTISAFPSCYFHEEDEILVRHGSLNY